MNFKGQAAIVTADNSGIGMAIMLEIARQGSNRRDLKMCETAQ